MTAFRAFRYTFIILAVAAAAAVGACLLPENPYQRWQLLDGTIHARARWIYERSHFDPTPIDVAFVGPSRTAAGVDAPRLSAELAARGLPSNVVNFSLPETGRNLNYAVVRQMLRDKRPKLIVIGMIEKPSRTGHPAFKYVASPDLIVDPGYFGDLNYFSDLFYLPYRQMRLFLADLAPSIMGIPKTFNPSRYGGRSLDTTGDIHLPDGKVKNGHDPASAAELARGVRKFEAGAHPPFLPAAFADIEFGDERHYVRRIVDLARANGARVAFLAIPYYDGPASVQEARLYERYGPLWNAGFVARKAQWYADYGHLTHTGADHLTDWLVGPVTAMLTGPPSR